MPRRREKIVVGETSYNGLAPLRRAWAERCSLLRKPVRRACRAVEDGFVKEMSEADSQWYLAAALAGGGKAAAACRKFGKTLSEITQNTRVYVGRSDLPLARKRAGKPKKQGALRSFPVFASWDRAKAGRRGAKPMRVVWLGRRVEITSSAPLVQLRPADLGLDIATSRQKSLENVMRETIAPQIRAFKRVQFKRKRSDTEEVRVPCGLCARPLTSSEVHVDHGTGIQAFAHIKSTFLAGRDAAEMTRRFYDPSTGVAQAWANHHKHFAKLTVTCAQCNLVQGKGSMVTV